MSNLAMTLPLGFAALPAERADPSQPHLEPVGTAGTKLIAGFLQEEYKGELATLSTRVETYEKMRSGEATIEAILNVIELPLGRAKYDVEPASQDPKDLEVAAWVKHNFFDNDRDFRWKKWMFEALSNQQFGFSLFEHVDQIGDWTYEVQDNQGNAQTYPRPGMVHLRNLSFLGQRTLDRWLVNQLGHLLGIVQYGWFLTETGGSQYKSNQFVDGEFIAAFVNKKLGNNMEGRSVLRCIHKNWKAQDVLYRIEVIGLEKVAVGIPVITEPPGATEGDRTKAKRIVTSFRFHEEAGMVLPPGWKLEFAQGTLLDDAIQAAITHHKGQMLLSVFAQFLAHGQDDQSGNRALAGTMKDFLLMTLWSIGEDIAEGLNDMPVKRLVDLNYTVTRYPRIVLKQITDDDIETAVDMLVKLVTAKVVTPYPSMEKHLLSQLRMPDKPEEEVQREEELRKQQAEAQVQAPSGIAQEAKQGQPTQSGQGQLSEKAVELREKKSNPVLDAIGRTLDTGTTAFQREAGALLAKQQARVTKELEKALGLGSLDRILEEPVPFADEYQRLLEKHILAMSTAGARDLAKQMGREPADEAILKTNARIQAILHAKKHVADMRFAVYGPAQTALTEQRLQPDTATKLSEVFAQRSLTSDVGWILEVVREVLK